MNANTSTSDFPNFQQRLSERAHLILLNEAIKGLEDVAAGRVKPASATLRKLKRRTGSSSRVK